MTRKSRKKSRIRARQARRNVAYSVAARTSAVTIAPSEVSETVTTSVVLVVPGRQLGYRGQIYDLQCVAATKRGARCRNSLHPHGQVAKWDRLNRYRLDWEIEDPYWTERYGSIEKMLATFVQQRCKLHVDGDAPDAVPHEIYDIGPVEPLPTDAFDAIGRRVYPGLMVLLKNEVNLSRDPDIASQTAAARAGDMAPLLELVDRHRLPLDLRPVHIGVPDPNHVHAPLWMALLEARMREELTDDHLAQCLTVGAPSLVDELG
ncbi:hypothetical protein ACTD5D_40790 [Nocardia takedensis]|uniref:hypothetical protein n=1 Tax=Nocardia takedensis TaxID=259390 RepID=UPI003F76E2C4